VGLLGPDRGLLLTPQAAERLTEAIPESYLVEVSGSNHYTILLAEELGRNILSFLERAPAGSLASHQ
jgi:hypothetical protein